MDRKEREIKLYAIGISISTCGDWLRGVVLNWIVVVKLGGSTSDNMLRAMLCSLLLFVASALPVIRLSAKRMMIVVQLIYMALSLMLFAAIQYNLISIQSITIFELITTFVGILASATHSQFEAAIAGDRKKSLSDKIALLYCLARMFAGLIIFVLVVKCGADVGVVLLIDAMSFVPFILAINFSPVSSALQTEAGKTIRANTRYGFRLLFRSAGSWVLFSMLLLESANLFSANFVFRSCSERLGRDLKLELDALSIWAIVTGATSFGGMAIYQRLSRRKQKWWFLIALVVAPLNVIALGLAKDYWTFIGFYVVLCVVSMPTFPTFRAFILNRSDDDVSGISRAQAVLNSLLIMPLTWVVSVFCAKLELNSGETLAHVAGACFVVIALTLTALLIRDRHFFEKHLPSR